jgi:hypothetical protein
METEMFFKTILQYFSDGGNLLVLAYAAATLALTQLFKKLFIDRIKVEIYQQFNFATVMPFVFGLIFALLDTFLINRKATLDTAVYDILFTTAATGALSSVIFKVVKAVSGKSIKEMLKDGTFKTIFCALAVIAEVKDKLYSGEIKLAAFVVKVKTVSDAVKELYSTDAAADKRQALADILTDAFGEVPEEVIDSLHEALSRNSITV